ncbi:major facilitator superfamily domain-containing protein [Hypoxylon fragiforme]|uniref:major facilitator superfamily domain-containing protein n=1 Tax=Hypoxylon fragiforme TaxID=63214 RepID=UPI0020C6A3E4|nr:major facilitator superfamily domain-containing protein [Hypoxylon fragiforme]KAI2605453.1 major facilitator superfamily domain-containing protein [Hypoxylon fragiforme]
MDISTTESRVGEPPRSTSSPLPPKPMSAYSGASQESPPKHTISHEEAALVPTDVPITSLTEADCPDALAFAFPTWKKWLILTVIFLVQTSMNLNASLYANGQNGIVREFGVSPQAAVSGTALFLVMYAFGCELWAPWSEELGRKPVLQGSLFLVNLCCIPVGLARLSGYFPAIIIGRVFGGLFSAGGSVTLGVVADMFGTAHQEHPLAFIVLSSVCGSIIGPIIGGFIEEHLHWTWTVWIQLIFGVFVQVLHMLIVPETRSSVLIDRHAKKIRETRLKEKNEVVQIFGPTETKSLKEYLVPGELFTLWLRPFHMFVKEPIVSVLSTLSGFSDALIFMQIQSFGRVFKLWNFSNVQVGLAFIPIGLAYILAYLLFIPVIHRNRALRLKYPLSEHAQYESRLWWLLYTAPCLPIGLLIFAWTSTPAVHWIGPMIGCIFIGVANYTIYMTTIDYMVAAYGPYSASATGGNGFARDLMAGLLTWAAEPYYNAFSFEYGLQVANTVLAGVSLFFVVATFFVYVYGPVMREHSPFAQSIRRHRNSETMEMPPTTTI